MTIPERERPTLARCFWQRCQRFRCRWSDERSLPTTIPQLWETPESRRGFESISYHADSSGNSVGQVSPATGAGTAESECQHHHCSGRKSRQERWQQSIGTGIVDRNNWKSWSKVPLRSKELLPSYSGIYIVTDQTECVLYVGQSKNIKDRWVGHHRHKQLIRRDRKDRRFYIYFNNFPVDRLDEKEKYYINLLNPSLNSTKVTKYVPGTLTVESILTKLLRAINRKTSLFPDLRSLVLGCWYSKKLDGSYCHVAIAAGINDFNGPIRNSAYPKNIGEWARGVLKKNTNWRYYETHCGLSEDEYHPTRILTYLYQGWVIHFVWIGWEIIHWARANRESLLEIKFFDVEIYCLNDPHILKAVELERYNYVIDGKKQLYDSDFILSVLPSIHPATHLNQESAPMNASGHSLWDCYRVSLRINRGEVVRVDGSVGRCLRLQARFWRLTTELCKCILKRKGLKRTNLATQCIPIKIILFIIQPITW